MKLAVSEVENLVKNELDADVDWIENGMFTLAEDEEQFEQAKKQCAEKQADGIACRMVDSKELHEAEPNLAPDIYGAIEFTEGGSLNPMLFGFALGEKVEKLGGELMRFTRAVSYTHLVGLTACGGNAADDTAASSDTQETTASGDTATDDDMIYFAAVGPLTGTQADFGKHALWGAQVLSLIHI